jgi:hypothetical protein
MIVAPLGVTLVISSFHPLPRRQRQRIADGAKRMEIAFSVECRAARSFEIPGVLGWPADVCICKGGAPVQVRRTALESVLAVLAMSDRSKSCANLPNLPR